MAQAGQAGKRQSCGTFYHPMMVLGEGPHRFLDEKFGYFDTPVDHLRADFEGHRSRFDAAGSAVRDGVGLLHVVNPADLESTQQGRRVGRPATDERGSACMRIQGNADTTGEPASADLEKNRVDIRRVFGYLEPYRALPRDDIQIIVGRHENAPRGGRFRTRGEFGFQSAALDEA